MLVAATCVSFMLLLTESLFSDIPWSAFAAALEMHDSDLAQQRMAEYIDMMFSDVRHQIERIQALAKDFPSQVSDE